MATSPQASAPSTVPSRPSKVFCDHCQTFVGRSTYYRHRARYYDPRKRSWAPVATEEQNSQSSDSDSTGPEISDSPVQVAARPDSLRSSIDSRDEVNYSSNQSDFSSSSDEDVPRPHYDMRVVEDQDLSSEDESNVVECIPTASFLGHLKYMLAFIVIWQFAFKISNAAITSLLHFLRWFTTVIGQAFHCSPITEMGNAIPLTLQSVHHLISLENDDFLKYVVCPTCDSIYEYNDCVEVTRTGRKESKRCQHVQYPNYPHPSRRKPCKAMLLKKVRAKQGYVLIPIKVYPYKPLKKSIEQLVKRKGLLSSCEKWRTRSVPNGFLCDIYDGDIWDNYNSVEGKTFLTCPNSWLLTLNVDWFEQFERGVYSVGAIYMSIQNLPRDVRYLPENIIIVGIIPGPREPKKTINLFLTPLVQELQEAWTHGLNVLSPQNTSVCVRLALSCVTCDIPASRKVCGFLSHNAALGCNKCLKRFPVTFGESTDFSGFDRENWEYRSLEQHQRGISATMNEVTKGGVMSSESQHGVRYSILMALPYFDPIRHTAIDSMHNLFLGTGKHIFSLWVERNILSKQNLSKIADNVKTFCVPAGIGRVPSSISSCYGSFTASQWKNWIIIYSPVLLKGLLPQEDFRCWLLFVRACSLLCSNCIRKTDVTSADMFLEQFCRQCVHLYGPTSSTFNMHLHMHLKQTFLDFGPPHASWCFAFERYNGILGSYHTNKREIEPQIMKKFSQNQAIRALDIPFCEEFNQLLPTSYRPTINSDKARDSLSLLHYVQSPLDGIDSFAFKHTREISLLAPFYDDIMTFDVAEQLEGMYTLLYPQCHFTFISRFCRKFGRITVAGDLIGSDMPGPNSKSSSVIVAYWAGRSHTLENIDYTRMRVGIVQYFLSHVLAYNNGDDVIREEHVFAYVFWKETHPHFDWYGVSATVCANMFESASYCCLLPVQRIGCRCAHTVMPVEFGDISEPVFIACPIPLNYSL